MVERLCIPTQQGCIPGICIAWFGATGDLLCRLSQSIYLRRRLGFGNGNAKTVPLLSGSTGRLYQGGQRGACQATFAYSYISAAMM